jgi:hypothetical protein
VVEKKRTPEEEAALRRYIMAEEDRAKLTSEKWIGGYRWFRSTNIVCIEHYRPTTKPVLLLKAS